ncbi:hypothetical protein ACFSTC_05160 [Nonomuraea ferruginea]
MQLEVRNAAPEYDQRSLTQRLSIPALIMVLLALFAVLIFEGRLRRMAHAAAVRKAGPQAGAYPGAYPQQPGPYPHQAEGYPAGPGYATAGVAAPGYPGGTAYAPIISFVPVQTFPSGQVQYGAVYHDPNAPPHRARPPCPSRVRSSWLPTSTARTVTSRASRRRRVTSRVRRAGTRRGTSRVRRPGNRMVTSRVRRRGSSSGRRSSR